MLKELEELLDDLSRSSAGITSIVEFDLEQAIKKDRVLVSMLASELGECPHCLDLEKLSQAIVGNALAREWTEKFSRPIRRSSKAPLQGLYTT